MYYLNLTLKIKSKEVWDQFLQLLMQLKRVKVNKMKIERNYACVTKDELLNLLIEEKIFKNLGEAFSKVELVDAK